VTNQRGAALAKTVIFRGGPFEGRKTAIEAKQTSVLLREFIAPPLGSYQGDGSFPVTAKIHRYEQGNDNNVFEYVGQE